MPDESVEAAAPAGAVEAGDEGRGVAGEGVGAQLREVAMNE